MTKNKHKKNNNNNKKPKRQLVSQSVGFSKYSLLLFLWTIPGLLEPLKRRETMVANLCNYTFFKKQCFGGKIGTKVHNKEVIKYHVEISVTNLHPSWRASGLRFIVIFTFIILIFSETASGYAVQPGLEHWVKQTSTPPPVARMLGMPHTWLEQFPTAFTATKNCRQLVESGCVCDGDSQHLYQGAGDNGSQDQLRLLWLTDGREYFRGYTLFSLD